MARQRRRTREQWIEIVEGYVQSDQTQQRYAHRRGVSVSSLQYWLKKLRDERFRKATSEMTMCSPVEFVEVFQAGTSTHQGEGSRVTLHSSGFSLEFETLPHPAWVAELISETTRTSTC